jgi:carbon monoxide dehydrogenase subunit G
MELKNDFTVNAPIDQAWETLTDVERIAPCLPGAQLQEVEGETYRGVVKVKVGPITAQFKGEAKFKERDETGHRAVLEAKGRDTAGKGNASALITAKLEPLDADVTKVSVDTDLTITGKVAQFGRGALADVSDKLLKQFVANLETTVLSSSTPGGGGAAGTASEPTTEPTTEPVTVPPTGPATEPPPATGNGAATAPSVAASSTAPARKIEHGPVDPIDLIEHAAAPLLKRLLPVLVGVVILVLVLRRRRRG